MLDITCGQLVISSVDEVGAAASLNEQTGPSSRNIRVGCIVAEVNGQRGDGHELMYLLDRAAEQHGDYTVVLKQPIEFCTTVARDSANSYGLELRVFKRASFLEVRSAGPGHIGGNAKDILRSHDRIVEVNGFKGAGKKLLHHLQLSERCTLKICRLPLK